jgi:hypothetical protein
MQAQMQWPSASDSHRGECEVPTTRYQKIPLNVLHLAGHVKPASSANHQGVAISLRQQRKQYGIRASSRGMHHHGNFIMPPCW